MRTTLVSTVLASGLLLAGVAATAGADETAPPRPASSTSELREDEGPGTEALPAQGGEGPGTETVPVREDEGPGTETAPAREDEGPGTDVVPSGAGPADEPRYACVEGICDAWGESTEGPGTDG